MYAGRWNEASVAVKRLDTHDLGLSEPCETDHQVLEALRAEVGLLATLRHPYIVTFMGFCVEPPAIVT